MSILIEDNLRRIYEFMKQTETFGLKEVCSANDRIHPTGKGDLEKAADKKVARSLKRGNMHLCM